MDNLITIKGKKDRLEIGLNKEADFDTLIEAFKEKISTAKSFLGSGKAAIEFTKRDLTTEEEDALISILQDNSNLRIVFVFSKSESKNNSISTGRTIYDSVATEGPTKFYRGNLRAGRKLEYKGNIVILGDVNPGAEVVSTGNILVIGHLNGTVTAGTEDPAHAFIGALYMNPVHLTIGEIFAKPLQNEILDTNKVDKKSKFKIAHIKDWNIVIEDFDVRSFK